MRPRKMFMHSIIKGFHCHRANKKSTFPSGYLYLVRKAVEGNHILDSVTITLL